ncbi:uncharacterized protein LOC126902295 [Daktulosphaira vitifoliae]|uniref:uncharacterized protein LOC126902295 n=1 Tax=Daktulosphaira vitifoliae TaxID=58002 RepID=UPI0021AA49B5|nr:uncharacterized protein LOC126902295 [Daktulosphaira vitifoliae]
MSDSTNFDTKKYNLNCLGKVLLELAMQDKLRNLKPSCDTRNINYFKNEKIKKKDNAFYLRNLGKEHNYFTEKLKTLSPKSPFYENELIIHKEIKSIIDALEITKEQLYTQKAVYIHKCNVPKLKNKRLIEQILKKYITNLQTAKYLNTVIQLIIERKFQKAKQKVNLMKNYLKKRNCKQISQIMDLVYLTYGVAYYLTYKHIQEWNDKENHQRLLTMLGATTIYQSKSIIYQDSFMGSRDLNPKYS